MSFTLKPLSVADTRGLIDFRLREAGAVGGLAPVFDDGAVKTIYPYAQGSPRETVTLCRNALLLAAQIRTRQIGQAVILHTIEKTTLPDPERHARISEVLREAHASQVRVTPPDGASPGEGLHPRQRVQSVLQERANRLLLNAEGNRGNVHNDQP